MKLISRHIERDGSGRVTIVPEEDEDMYHLYNLVEVGDNVRAAAVRRVQSESNTGSIESHRIRTTLTLRVEKLQFDASGSSAAVVDPGAASGGAGGSGANSGTVTPSGDAAPGLSALGGSSGQGATLSVSGRVVEENKHVKMGAFHTLDIECGRSVGIDKQRWDSVHLERLQEAGDANNRAEVGAVVMGEGTAVVCLLTSSMTLVRQRIDVALPRKHKSLAASAHEKAVLKFHQQVYTAVTRLLGLPAIRLIILASPGFTKDTVYDYLFAEATRRGDKLLTGNEVKRKFLRVACASPHIHSLMEVLRTPEVSSQLSDTKFAREGQLLDKFQRTLASDELRAWYGEEHVMLAASRGAIGSLLISDGLFRSPDPARRKTFVQLVEDVRSAGGEAVILSGLHESGKTLNGLTGIAAILRFPLDIEVVEEEEGGEARARARAETEER
ncbi:hypothetical protein IE81DRAFT_326125 [Ceraceosorus guamensis]|uniref:Protein DOM34 homolog n=1 Tax=Ceraceosorus guamensis TaxID=1522189 RepID=A0A316VQE8_9BASI|nr:hypothetical protein IE81DRAFT_326125 [Ceraceosorus guamensis]PWN39827.1 hypothetical protein IE81DRAFT_326125 [Ceraceosorus guamensis]